MSQTAYDFDRHGHLRARADAAGATISRFPSHERRPRFAVPRPSRPRFGPRPRRPAYVLRQGDARRPLSAGRRKLSGHVRPRLLRAPTPTMSTTRRAFMTQCRASGSCAPRRRSCPNGGTSRGLPISCFLNTVSDSLDGIVATWNENVALASNGGGIGTYWGKVRSIGEPVKALGRNIRHHSFSSMSWTD